MTLVLPIYVFMHLGVVVATMMVPATYFFLVAYYDMARGFFRARKLETQQGAS